MPRRRRDSVEPPETDLGDVGATPNEGVVLGDLTWIEAERVLTPEAVVVIPLGAAAKEHGPHLRLDNDLRMAHGLAARVLAAADVILAPALPYHFYPAFVDYPGSTTLRFDTARDVVVDVCLSLSHHGPRRFYVLNTGLSTLRPLEAAATLLAHRGILLRFTDWREAIAPLEATLLTQEAGTHADEGETSMMLVLAPNRVDMAKSVRDIHEKKPPKLTRDPNAPGLFSPSGVYGDATLATRDKGVALLDAIVRAILRDLDALKSSMLPAVSDGSRESGEGP